MKNKTGKMVPAKKSQKSRKRGSSKSPSVAPDVEPYKFDDEQGVADVLSDAEQYIYEYEERLNDGEVTSEDAETLISEMNCIRDRLEDFADDGWGEYRDVIEEFSNRLWLLGVAWPQYLPPWHVADTVVPSDIGIDIRKAWIYEEDFLAIRKMSDAQKMTFKAMVNELVEIGRRKFKMAK